MLFFLLLSCDGDHDGFTKRQGDCNNDEPNQHPLAREVCDEIDDNDCKGDTKELVVPDDFETIQQALEEYTENDIICIRGEFIEPESLEITSPINIGGFVDEESILYTSGLTMNIINDEAVDATLSISNLTLSGDGDWIEDYVIFAEGISVDIEKSTFTDFSISYDSILSLKNSNLELRNSNFSGITGVGQTLNFQGEYSNTASITDTILTESEVGFWFEKGNVFIRNFYAHSNLGEGAHYNKMLASRASLFSMVGSRFESNRNMDIDIDFAGTDNGIVDFQFTNNVGFINILSNENVNNPPRMAIQHFWIEENTFNDVDGAVSALVFQGVDASNILLRNNQLNDSGLTFVNSTVSNLSVVDNVTTTSNTRQMLILAGSSASNFIVEGLSTGPGANKYGIRVSCESSLQFGVVYGGKGQSGYDGGGIRHGCGAGQGADFSHIVIMNNSPYAFSPSYDGPNPRMDQVITYQNDDITSEASNAPNYGSDLREINPDFVSMDLEDLGLTAFRLKDSSQLLHRSSTELDWNDEAASMSPFGGPKGSLWDLDNDGFYANPGNISDGSGDTPKDKTYGDWDCNDLDATIGNGECD